MKHLNHRGSAFLLALTVVLAVLMLLSALGISGDWKPKTTPFRLVNEPFIGWALLIVLSAGLVLIHVGDELAQCVGALVFGGVTVGLALVSVFFWDTILGVLLVNAAAPVLRSASLALKSMTPLGSANAASKQRAARAG